MAVAPHPAPGCAPQCACGRPAGSPGSSSPGASVGSAGHLWVSAPVPPGPSVSVLRGGLIRTARRPRSSGPFGGPAGGPLGVADEAPVGGLAPGAEEGPERRRWAGLGPASRGCPRAPASCGVCPAVCVSRGLGAVRRRGEAGGARLQQKRAGTETAAVPRVEPPLVPRARVRNNSRGGHSLISRWSATPAGDARPRLYR